MDFVTICFWDDLPQMKIQARSMDLFLKRFPIDRIIVVVNDSYQKCLAYFEQQVRSFYGDLSHRVELVDGSSLLELYHGYDNQMQLKIMSSKLVTSYDYVMLDAKNYLVKEWHLSDIQHDGKFISNFMQYEQDRSLACANSFRYFDLDFNECDRIETLTPYFARTDVIQSLANDERLIPTWKDQWLNEFYLMQAAMISRGIGIQDYYYTADLWRSTVWKEYIQYHSDASTYINNLFRPTTLVSGIHRRVFDVMPGDVMHQQQMLWNELGIANMAESTEIIREMKILNPCN